MHACMHVLTAGASMSCSAQWKALRARGLAASLMLCLRQAVLADQKAAGVSYVPNSEKLGVHLESATSAQATFQATNVYWHSPTTLLAATAVPSAAACCSCVIVVLRCEGALVPTGAPLKGRP